MREGGRGGGSERELSKSPSAPHLLSQLNRRERERIGGGNIFVRYTHHVYYFILYSTYTSRVLSFAILESSQNLFS